MEAIFSYTRSRRADTAVDFDGHPRIRADSATKVDELHRLLTLLPGSLDVEGSLRGIGTNQRRVDSVFSETVRPNSWQVTTITAIVPARLPEIFETAGEKYEAYSEVLLVSSIPPPLE